MTLKSLAQLPVSITPPPRFLRVLVDLAYLPVHAHVDVVPFEQFRSFALVAQVQVGEIAVAVSAQDVGPVHVVQRREIAVVLGSGAPGGVGLQVVQGYVDVPLPVASLVRPRPCGLPRTWEAATTTRGPARSGG